MCLVLLAVKRHPRYKLILAANRDEYFDRPSAPPSFWTDAPELLAGRDLKGGGTWMGITRGGRIAATTNYRDPVAEKKNAPSRGLLVKDYLLGDENPRDYLKRVSEQGNRYNSFNLIVGYREELYWHSNRARGIQELTPGIYGISNRLLDTPWPKVTRSKQRLSELLTHQRESFSEELFHLLTDHTPAPDDLLPDTGVGIEWERILSSIFITSPTYGTRSSTLLFIDHKDRVTFLDKTFNAHPDPIASHCFEFDLDLQCPD